MKRTFLVRALLGAAIPMMMAEDVLAATQAAPEGGAPAGESSIAASEASGSTPTPTTGDAASAPSESPTFTSTVSVALGSSVITDTTAATTDAPAVAQSGEPAVSRPDAAVTALESSGGAPASGTAAAPLESSGTSAIPSAVAASSTNSSSSATTTLSTAAAPDTSSTAAPPDPTTAALSSATADATLADAGGIPPSTAPALDPALGQIPAPPTAPAETADPADPAEAAAAPVSPVMFEIYAASPYLPPIRIYADGHIDGLPDGYQVTINRGHAIAAELENLKADDRHLSLLASWHKEMEVLGRGLSGEVTRLLGETKKYLEDVL
ncbi:hypothetical protein QZL74_15495 [Burkholderia gladioli pv. alliicola]|uniref:hypothetical protein n=1 Tax=Burkholderia gladioli TaxID=28095 RepID=UPI003D817578